MTKSAHPGQGCVTGYHPWRWTNRLRSVSRTHNLIKTWWSRKRRKIQCRHIIQFIHGVLPRKQPIGRLVKLYETLPRDRLHHRPGYRNRQMQMRQLRNGHSPANKINQPSDNPLPQHRMGDGITVDLILVHQLASRIMKELDIHSHDR